MVARDKNSSIISEVNWVWFWKYPTAHDSSNLITSGIQALLVSFCRISSEGGNVLSEAAAGHLSAILRTVSSSVTELSFPVLIDSIKHRSKRGNNFHTSFSYTRCSVQSRIWTLRRMAPSRIEVTGLNCSDHSTSLKTGLVASCGASIRHGSRSNSTKHTMLWLQYGSLQT